MSPEPDPADYRTFLLRVWHEAGSAERVWRCSLEDPRTHARRGFEDIVALSAFLARLYGVAARDARRPATTTEDPS